MKKVIKERDMIQSAEELSKNPISIEHQLTHDETVRASALSIACRYYVETIVKDGELYREMVRENRVLKPATYVGVIEVAIAFEAYLRGELKATQEAIVEGEPRPEPEIS